MRSLREQALVEATACCTGRLARRRLRINQARPRSTSHRCAWMQKTARAAFPLRHVQRPQPSPCRWRQSAFSSALRAMLVILRRIGEERALRRGLQARQLYWILVSCAPTERATTGPIAERAGHPCSSSKWRQLNGNCEEALKSVQAHTQHCALRS